MPTQTSAQFTAMIKREPAAASYSVAAALIPVLTQALHWDTKQAGAASAILVALASIIAAWKARPVSPALLYGGATAIASALAAWHLKLSAADLSYVSSVVTMFLGAHMRGNLTPVVALRPGGR